MTGPFVKLGYPMKRKSLTPQQVYEAKGKRPGTPVSTRLSDGELRALDDRRGEEPRAAWLLALIRRELRPNEPPPKRRKRS